MNGKACCQSTYVDTWSYTPVWLIHSTFRKILHGQFVKGETRNGGVSGVWPVYLTAERCRCLRWLSHFLCVRSFARQQWWCKDNGLQILKEERSGETEAAMFMCVCCTASGRRVRARVCMGAWRTEGRPCCPHCPLYTPVLYLYLCVYSVFTTLFSFVLKIRFIILNITSLVYIDVLVMFESQFRMFPKL